MAESATNFAGAVWSVVLLAPAAVACGILSALLERSGPIRLRHWAEEAGGRLRSLYELPRRFGAFRMLLSLLARLTPIALFFACERLFADAGSARPGSSALGVTALLVAAVELVNRTVVLHDAEVSLRVLTAPYRAAYLVLMPAVAVLTPVIPSPADGRQHEDEEDEASDEEIEAFIDVGTREGILEPEQGEWVTNIVGFADTQVRSVMTPRIDMVCMEVDADLDALADAFIDSGHSRIPLYEESIDRIIGILHLRELFRAVRSGEPPQIRELLSPPLFVPETKPLGELLKEFQARYQQVAIVVDEYGGTAGLVSVEDLLEEIVGEIVDEHEAAADPVEPIADGAWRLDGRAHIEVLDDLFGVEVEEPEYETVAGLIFSALGHVPHEGETVEHEGLRFTVEGVEDRRIKTVKVERIAPAGAEDEAEGVSA